MRDLRALLWSSIDNRESRDLDQVEYAERLPGGEVRLLIGVADVDSCVPRGSAIDRRARANTVSVYTPGAVFHMLPEQLATELTSLLEDADRLAVVTELTVAEDGRVVAADVYRAAVRNRRKLVYESVGVARRAIGVPRRSAGVEGLEARYVLQTEDGRVVCARCDGRTARWSWRSEATSFVTAGGDLVTKTARLQSTRELMARDT